MVDPVIALIVFALIVIVAIVIYWIWRYTSILQNRNQHERILVEDVLKQLYHLEQSGQEASLVAMAGALKIKDRIMLILIEKMSEQDLIYTDRENLKLTDEGRAYALRVVRTHRLYEKYLSERTGVDKMEWHDRAEVMEHKLSDSDIERLSRSLGNPRFDPHGDPIPTAEGELRRPSRKPLCAMDDGTYGRIVHIEDEPAAIYQQIVDSKLHVGSLVKVIACNDKKVTFFCEGDTHTFSSIVATNVHVKPLQEADIRSTEGVRLSTLEQGEKGKILGISAECRGAARRRLLDLGFTPGTTIETELESPMREPKGFLLRNTLIALRSEQSDLIIIEKV